MKRIMSSVLAAMATCTCVLADVRLPALLGSHMVLQRDQPIHLWGWAEPDETVTAGMNGATQSTLTDHYGHWHIYLQPMPAGGPYTLTIKGAKEIKLDDVMLGDVWFASGQSNMEMPLKGFPGNAEIRNSEQEIRNSAHNDLRLFRTPKRASNFPLPDFDAEWTECKPETAAEFSAVAFFFGREIATREHVAIGLIDSTWGGTPAEAWTSMDGLGSDAALMPVFAAWAQMANRTAEMPAILKAEVRETDAAKRAGKPLPRHDWHPAPESWAPAGLYNGMVAAAVNYRIKGVIWYQGESNSQNARANMYERVFPAMISDWRTQWHQGDFPFLFVQIANFGAGPGESYFTVREAQRRTLKLVNTAMAVTIDIGQPENVHPANKQDVGLRLALAAESFAYGKKLDYSGPMFRETSCEGSALRVWFDHAAGGLAGSATGFELGDAQHHFVPASARIDGASIVLTAESMISPQYVRYGWANAPVLDLKNGAGLPASPFTSEESIPLVALSQ